MAEGTGGSPEPAGAPTKATVHGRFYSHICTFRTTWGQVAQALWRRYPNPFSKHVLTEDTVSRRSIDDKLISRRLVRKTNKAPKWMDKFVGGPGAAGCIVEESIVDAASQTFTTYTRNINFTRLLSVEEKCVYYVSPENENWTCCKKQAWIKCGVTGLSRFGEKFGVDRYKKNAAKAERGLEFVIEKLFHSPKLDFVTSIARIPKVKPPLSTKASV